MKKTFLLVLVILSMTACEKDKVESVVPSPQEEPIETGLQVGDIHAGGIIFYLAGANEDLNGDGTTDKGLVASLSHLQVDLKIVFQWGCSGKNLDDEKVPNVTLDNSAPLKVDGPGAEIGDGAKNTRSIVALCPDSLSAAKVCDNYEYIDENGVKYDDWFLPSINELVVMQNSIPAQLGLLLYKYWSSTECSDTTALLRHSYGYLAFVSDFPKNEYFFVRAVRAF